MCVPAKPPVNELALPDTLSRLPGERGHARRGEAAGPADGVREGPERPRRHAGLHARTHARARSTHADAGVVYSTAYFIFDHKT